MLALLLESQLPLPEALRLTGEGVQDSDVDASCRIMAKAGRVGPFALASHGQAPLFPVGLPRLLRWAENHESLPEVLHMAGAMFESRGRTYSTFVGTVLNVICVLLVMSMVMVVPALFVPLITLISFVGINRSFRENTVATGPAEPFARQETHWEEGDVASSVSVPRRLIPRKRIAGRDGSRRVYFATAGDAMAAVAHDVLGRRGRRVLWLVVLVYDSISARFSYVGGHHFRVRDGDGRGRYPSTPVLDPAGFALVGAGDRGRTRDATLPRRRGVRRTVLGAGLCTDHGPGRPLERGDHAPRGARTVARSRVARRGITRVGRTGRRQPAASPPPGRHHPLDPVADLDGNRGQVVVRSGRALVTQTIACFILYFIIPKFEAIFKDFNLPLPATTIWVIDGTHVFIKYGYITLVFLLIEVGLLVFLPLSFLAWGNYTIPLFDRLLGRRHTALVLRSLGLMVEGGKPMLLALSTLAQHYPTGWVRRRLRRV